MRPDLVHLDAGGFVDREPSDARPERDQRQETARPAAATSSVDRVARRMTSADVGPPSSIVAAWMTQRQGIEPHHVETASPSPIGAAARLSESIKGPPAREIAAATPPPCSSDVFAAFAIASTSKP